MLRLRPSQSVLHATRSKVHLIHKIVAVSGSFHRSGELQSDNYDTYMIITSDYGADICD